MSDLQYLKEKVDGMDVKLDTLLLTNTEFARVQGKHEGRLDAHDKQMGWIWGFITSSFLLSIGAVIRSIT